MEKTALQNQSTQVPLADVSAVLAARAEDGARLASALRFPADGGGRSLAEMAQRDLDAALQLLADRAQYITGATGAAIALRRNGKNDMLCRASTGSNAPELGALLSTEFGLSGESVRTRQALRCDDAERDARVNHDVCRQLGIASVVVMPVVNDDEVLGVFELFSGRPNAFGERDLSAVQRLSEMVETAVRLAHAAEFRVAEENIEENILEDPSAEVVGLEGQEAVLEVAIEAEPLETQNEVVASTVAEPDQAVVHEPLRPDLVSSPMASPVLKSAPVAETGSPSKPLFWSATVNPAAEPPRADTSDQSHVPPVLRNLWKCQACGFPVSAGRVLCVECEDKKWRGTLRTSLAATRRAASQAQGVAEPKPEARTFAAAVSAGRTPITSPQIEPAASSISQPVVRSTPILPVNEAKTAASPALAASPVLEAVLPPSPPSSETAPPALVLSAGLQPSQSWLAQNKYILAALLVVAGGLAALALLR